MPAVTTASILYLCSGLAADLWCLMQAGDVKRLDEHPSHLFIHHLFWGYSIACRMLYFFQDSCNCVCLPPGLSWSEAQEWHLISGIWEFREDQFERTWAQCGMCGSLTVAIAICGLSGKIYNRHATYMWKHIVDIFLSVFPLTHKVNMKTLIGVWCGSRTKLVPNPHFIV